MISRAGICLAAYVIVFILMLFIPIPDGWYISTPTQVAIELLAAPAVGHLYGCEFCGQTSIFQYRAYFQTAGFLACVASQPVMIYQLLALASPASGNRGRLMLATFATIVAFIVGLLFCYIVVLLIVISIRINWNQISISVVWTFTAYIDMAITYLLHAGLAFQWPVLVASLAWLNRPRAPSPRLTT